MVTDARSTAVRRTSRCKSDFAEWDGWRLLYSASSSISVELPSSLQLPADWTASRQPTPSSQPGRPHRHHAPAHTGTPPPPAPGSSKDAAAPACCCIGIVSSQWQKLSSSLLSPVFSEPNSSATRPPAAPLRHASRRIPAAHAADAERPLSHRRRPHHQRAVRHRRRHIRVCDSPPPAPPTRRPPTAPPQTAPQTHSPRADRESRSHASPAPPLRCSADSARAPAPPQRGRASQVLEQQ